MKPNREDIRVSKGYPRFTAGRMSFCLMDSDSFNITRPDFGKNPVEFFKEVNTELRKVTWPKRDTVLKLTAVVIAVSAVVGVYLGGLDFVFAKGIEILLKK